MSQDFESSDTNTRLPLKRKRRKNSETKASLLSNDVRDTLDRSKITDRQAVCILASAAHSLGHSVENVTLSRSSICRARLANRKDIAGDIKGRFSADGPLTVHWDGKLLPDITGHEKVDRLPVIITGAETDTLLGVPKLSSGTGQAQANAALACIDEWKVTNWVMLILH